jgi:hypothetical protein
VFIERLPSNGRSTDSIENGRSDCCLATSNNVRNSIVACVYATEGCLSEKTRVEAGSNTSIVTLRVVGGDEKGSLKSETVKYGRKSQGTRTRERLCWQGPATHTKDRPVLSSERAPHGINNVTVRRIPCGNKIWSQAPDGCFIPRQTGLLTVGRNIRLRLRRLFTGRCLETFWSSTLYY